jgi:large exoprotein involved in heme utilization and adhesion
MLVSGIDEAGYPSAISGSADDGSRGRGGAVVVTADQLEVRDGGQINSSTWGAGDAGQVTVNARHLVVSGVQGAKDLGYTSVISGSAEPGSSGRGGAVTITADQVDVRDSGQIATSTSGAGAAGQVIVNARHLLVSGEVSAISGSAEPGSSGRGGTIVVTADQVDVRDGGQILSGTFADGDAGQVSINARHLVISGMDEAGNPSVIRSSADVGSRGAGGAVDIQAQTILLQNYGAVRTGSDGSGPGGPLSITATKALSLDHADVEARTETANGGNITLAVGRLFNVKDSNVVTSVAGGMGSGGNIFITPHLMVLDGSRIEANAKRGTGGKITIQTGQLIRTPDSVIQASSEFGLSGTITIVAPNTDVSSSLTVLPETFLDASTHLRETCAARGGRPASSFSAGGRGGLPPDPGAPLTASPFGPSLEQQTATGSPTALTAKPPPAAKPITVSGIPQPVLGSPRLTCRG